MRLVDKITDYESFAKSILTEIQKFPFGVLPKTELELLILDTLIRSIEPNEPYSNIEKHFNLLKTELKLSQTQLKNKLLAAQLRFDLKTDKDVEHFILNTIITRSFVQEGNAIVITIFDPLLNDQTKSYFEVRGIITDTSFNKSILKINLNGLVQFMYQLKDISTTKRNELTEILLLAENQGLVNVVNENSSPTTLEKVQSVSVIGSNLITILDKLSPLINSLLS
jgi:hypothetical protein